jgi:hypothetical protein
MITPSFVLLSVAGGALTAAGAGAVGWLGAKVNSLEKRIRKLEDPQGKEKQ